MVLLVAGGAARGHARPNLLLYHADQAEELRPLDLLWVEVVRFGYVQVADHILNSVVLEHVAVKGNVMVELLILPLLKMVHYGHLGRAELEHYLGGDRRHQRTRQRQRRQVHEFRIHVYH